MKMEITNSFVKWLFVDVFILSMLIGLSVSEKGCVDKAFIKAREGFRTTGYVPKDKDGNVLGHSGVTIGNGIDLGTKNEAYFTNLGVSTAVINKLKPYFGLQKDAAVTKLAQTPLTLSSTEAEDLSAKVMTHQITDVKNNYNGAIASDKKKWDDLTDAQRTVVASVLFQYGSYSRVPTFWKHAKNQDWTNVEAELRDFGDKYSSRRILEADHLKNDDGSNCGTATSTLPPPPSTTLAGGYTGKCNSIEKVMRADWSASNSKGTLPSLKNKPVKKLFIHHTTGAICSSKTDCIKRMKDTQDYHMNTRKYSDIGYNFLVGEDGRGYEGRGWDKIGGHTYGYNSKAVAISVIGDFTTRRPNDAAINVIKSLIDCAISQGILAADYELYGHRDASCTECPGNKLYEEIQKWPRYSEASIQKYCNKKPWNVGTSSSSASSGSSSTGSETVRCTSVEKVSRADWSATAASKPIGSLQNKPVQKVFIHHTTGPSCTTKAACIKRMQGTQNYHMVSPDRLYSDIGYNFLVGEDGRGYEGRGWDKIGGHTYGYNQKSVAISVIGNFNSRKPNDAALKAIKALIKCAIDEGVLAETYELYGHRDAACKDCPGHELYAEIQNWPGFSRVSIQKYCNTKPWNDGTSNSGSTGSSSSTTTSGKCDKLGDIRKLRPTGASADTAKQDRLSSTGVAASSKLVDRDVNELKKYKTCFDSTAVKYGLHPALIGALASRESRGGTQLKANGFGLWDANGYGLLQCDVKTSGLNCAKYGPKSCEHVDMMMKEILVKNVDIIQNKQKTWKKEQQLQGAVASYNFGTSNVQTWKRLDIGSTGNDYSNDVVARAQRLFNHHGWTCPGSTTAPTKPPSTIPTPAPSGNTCIRMQNEGNCEFYKTCVEKDVPCGSTGYAENYGYKYCNQFGKYINDFNQEGKDWVNEVRKCLMKALYPHTKSPGITCDKLRDIAFNTHVDCYTKSAKGICYVAWNKANAAALWKVYDADDFFGEDWKKAWKQVVSTMLSCNVRYAKDFGSWAASGAKTLYDNAKEKLKKFGTFVQELIPQGRRKRSTQTECKQYAQNGDCRFYECFEEKFPCATVGNYSHVLHFELPNCMEFDKLGISNSKVKAWMQNTQKCLMNALLPYYDGSSVDCMELELTMNEKHASCMVTGGFCPLKSADEFIIDRGTYTKGFPHISPVGYTNLPISKGVHMIEKYYYEELGEFKKQVGLANVICANEGKRKSVDLYRFVDSPIFGRHKQRTEL